MTLAQTIILVLAAMQLAASQAIDKNATLPAEVRKALDAIGNSLDSVTVSFEELRFEPPWKPEHFAAPRARQETRFQYVQTWQKQLIYERTRTFSNPAVEDYVEEERSIDGTVLYLGWNRKKGLVKQQPPVDKNNSFQFVYFHDAGFVVDKDAQNSLGSVVLSTIKGGQFIGRSDVTIDGLVLSCIQVRVPNRFQEDAARTNLVMLEANWRQLRAAEAAIQRITAEIEFVRGLQQTMIEKFYVDPSKNYALARRETCTEDGAIISRIVNDEFIEILPQHVWLPKRCTYSSYVSSSGFSQAPQRGHEIQVLSIETRPLPFERFVLNYTQPGTEIRDETGDRPKRYVIPFPGDPATGPSASATVPVQQPQHDSYLWPLVGIAFIAVIAFFLIYFFRQRHA